MLPLIPIPNRSPRPKRSHLPLLLVLLALSAGLALVVQSAQKSFLYPSVLAPSRYRSGDETLLAFAPISQAVRHSIVKFHVDGKTVALGAVVDSQGLVLTKASELKPGKLTCWLASDQEVSAQWLASDELEDLALVRVQAQGLKPLNWALEEVALGQWAISAGIASIPNAVGIVSALPRRIRPQRAFIGVQFDFKSSTPKIEQLLPGFGAEKAGLKPGDLIVALNNEPVSNRVQIIETLRDFRAGQSISLRVQRAQSEFQVQVPLRVPDPEELEHGFASQSRSSRLGGEVSVRAQGFQRVIEHDTVLPPWLCGGPLLNLQGKAIGLNIARAGRVTTYALPAQLVQQVLQRLQASASSRPSLAPVHPSSGPVHP